MNINTFRFAGIVPHSFVDGPGVRFAVFFQGCPHNCPGCQNPETHDIMDGVEIPTDYVIRVMQKTRYIDGVTLSGGDPLMQPEAAIKIADAAHDLGLSVWCYTGYEIESIPDKAREVLNHIDVLVDGKYIQGLPPAEYRGSSNQRIIPLRGDEIEEEDAR